MADDDKKTNYYREPKMVEVQLVNGWTEIISTTVRPRITEIEGIKFYEFLDENNAVHKIRMDAIAVIREHRKSFIDNLAETVKGSAAFKMKFNREEE